MKTNIERFLLASGSAIHQLIPFQESKISQLNCWIHEGFHFVATRGCGQAVAAVGGENLTGDAAKGTPRNLFTVAVAEGKEVVVPIRTPDATVA